MTKESEREVNDFDIKPATRVGFSPLIAIYSESGCGKTMSALLLARGLAGPAGKIVVGDSESRRASLYADVIPGGFETFSIDAPFSPARYCGALDAIWQSGAKVGVIDSGSHEWEGVGGVLDMAGENESKSGKTGLHNWRLPKIEHAKFIQTLLRSPIPLIVCLRAKYKTRQGKDERGKTVIIKDDKTSPIQAEDFIFEATCHFEILQNHSILLTKCSHPGLKKCFPSDQTTPITVEHGEALAAWCSAGGKVGSASGQRVDKAKELRKKLWALLKPVRGSDTTFGASNAWLRSQKPPIIGESEQVETMDAAALQFAFDKADLTLNPPQ
jgi:hypothetical protein